MEKIKQLAQSEQGKDILTVIIVILVGLGSFELGRLSKGNDSSGIKILPAQAGSYPDQSTMQAANVLTPLNNLNKVATSIDSAGKNFFASNRGTKYYSLGCSGGKTIKQENRLYFTTKEEAEGAGYELSSSCR